MENIANTLNDVRKRVEHATCVVPGNILVGLAVLEPIQIVMKGTRPRHVHSPRLALRGRAIISGVPRARHRLVYRDGRSSGLLDGFTRNDNVTHRTEFIHEFEGELPGALGVSGHSDKRLSVQDE